MYIADAIYLVLKGYEVTKVNLRGNHFKKFPKKMIDKYPNVTIMNFESNELAEVPEELSTWPLAGLNFAKNNLDSFPLPLYDIPTLRILDLSHNSFTELDVERLFTSCPNLMQLSLVDVPLKEATISKLNELKPANLKLALTA